ncbi:MAG: hypothetical protein IPH35_13060 [Rhodoferax sp.]|nr:hypothetical protein [Rhodoferax sp.]
MCILKVSCVTLLLVWTSATCAMVTDEDKKLIAAASCEEIVEEYKNFSAAEKKLKAEMQSASNETVATNVVGAATLAVFGLGFFSWDDNSDAKTNLAELTAYRQAIEAEGKRKKCNINIP